MKEMFSFLELLVEDGNTRCLFQDLGLQQLGLGLLCQESDAIVTSKSQKTVCRSRCVNHLLKLDQGELVYVC